MGSHMNFRNFGDAPVGDGSGSKPLGNLTLTRQSSIYSLTFDEFQNTLGGLGKDFGSMNMDELLKNIWSAEETQAMTSGAGGGQGSVPGENLQRQGSLTLPRTLSQKTVDEVWRDLFKETGGAKDGSGGGFGMSGGGGGVGGGAVSNLPQRQQTLGEITLEEFLVRAGVVREDMQQIGRPNNSGFLSELSKTNGDAGLAFGFQQPNRNNPLYDNRIITNPVPNQHPTIALNAGGVRSSQQQTLQPPPHLQAQQQQPLFPKQATVAFASPMHLPNTTQLASPKTKNSIIGIPDASVNNNLVQGSGLQSGGMNMVGLGNRGVTVAVGSPGNRISPDLIPKSNMDSSSLSPTPYVFGRGRKGGGPLEKVVERRQRRMIKNRESAARSRARKQAYTLELEAEVAKLKELNQELQTKQAEIMELQKNQIIDAMNWQRGGKRRCLRRTLTGPW